MRPQFLIVSFILLLNLFLSPIVSASVVYSYQGNFFDTFTSPSFYDNSMNISGSFQMASTLPIDSVDSFILDIETYSFSDGVFTYNNTNSFIGGALFETGSQGNISRWSFSIISFILTDPDDNPAVYNLGTGSLSPVSDIARIVPCSEGTCLPSDPGVLSGSIINNPGVWSVSVVPVPAAIWLFGSGLLGLIGFTRHRKNT